MRLRNEKSNVVGRSILINSLAICLNLVAVFFIVKGFHTSTVDNASTYQYLGFGLLILSLVSMYFLKGIFLFSYVSRAIVGGLFIVSGLVKANDPWGFAFKLEEYFAPDGLAFDYPFFTAFEPYVLEISILVCVAEIVLGVAVVLGGKIKLTSWLLILLMLFFTWLTWYTFSCVDTREFLSSLDPALLTDAQVAQLGRQCVTDCGCFGDALRGSVGRSLTPLESFWKDLVLLYFGLIIFFNQWRIKLNSVMENYLMIPASILVVIFFCWVFGWIFPLFFAIIAFLGAIVFSNVKIGKMGKAWKMAIYVSVITLLFSVYTSSYLPVKDYRPYAIGNNIAEKMNDGIDEVSDFVLYYKNKETQAVDTFQVDQWEIYGNTELYEYVDRKTIVISAGKPNSISDFLARVDYRKLTEEELKIPFIDSVIKADYYAYYQEKMVLNYAGGADTIAVMDYDTLYYPDSMYTKGDVFVDLIDPADPFSINLTNYLQSAENIFIMTIRDIENINENSMDEMKALYQGTLDKGLPFYVLSPASDQQIDAFKQKFDFNPTFLQFDGTEVKILVRSNPGLILIDKGTVIDKWPSRSIPDFKDVYKRYIEPK